MVLNCPMQSSLLIISSGGEKQEESRITKAVRGTNSRQWSPPLPFHSITKFCSPILHNSSTAWKHAYCTFSRDRNPIDAFVLILQHSKEVTDSVADGAQSETTQLSPGGQWYCNLWQPSPVLHFQLCNTQHAESK